MATSGQTISTTTRDNIITAALRTLVVLGEGQAPSAAQLTEGTRFLNGIVSEFRTLGMQSFARTETLIPLISGTFNYAIGIGQATNIPYPMYIYDVQVQQPPFDTEILMNQMAIYDFNMLPPGSNGVPVNYNYQVLTNRGELRVWPTPDASVPVGTRLRLTYQRPIEIFVAAGDEMDFPMEWANALIFALALVWSDSYGVPEAKKGWLEKQADKHVATAASTTNEQGSMFFKPAWEGY